MGTLRSDSESIIDIKLAKDGWLGIKKPSGDRRSFAIQQHIKVNGKPRVKTLKLEPLDALNAAFHEGKVSYKDALKKVESIKEAIYRQRDKDKPQVVFDSENLRVLDDYWRRTYTPSRLRKLKDGGKSMKHDLNRAVGACGKVSLLVGGQEELQDQIDSFLEDTPNKQRRVVTRLNQILNFLGRGFVLDKMPTSFEILHAFLKTESKLKNLERGIELSWSAYPFLRSEFEA